MSHTQAHAEKGQVATSEQEIGTMADFGPDGQLDPGEVMALGALGGAFADEMLRTEMEAEREIERLRRDPFGEEEAMASEARSWRIIRGADEGPGAASMPDDDDDWDDYDDDDDYGDDDRVRVLFVSENQEGTIYTFKEAGEPLPIVNSGKYGVRIAGLAGKQKAYVSINDTWYDTGKIFDFRFNSAGLQTAGTGA